MAENNTPRIHDEKRENVLPQVAIRMVQERPLISTEKMDSPKAAINVMSEFLSQMDRELVCVVNLQSDMKPINMNIVSIMQSLEMGVQNFLEGDQERYKEFLKVMTKFHNYSVNNTLLIAMQRPDATLCNSYKRWQSFGRQVKRGEKGITIIAPAPVKTKQTRERKDQYQQPVIGEDGHPELEEVEVVIPRFRPATVFAYEQTEGEPLPFLVPEELTASVENYEIFMEAITRVSTVPIR